MANLHWHTAENPCYLFGVPVTPENWEGGVVEWIGDGATGAWDWVHRHEAHITGCLHSYFITDEGRELADDLTRPIYPPPGFAGKSGAELWNAVFGGVDDGGRPYPGVAYLVSHLPGQEPYQTPCVLITQYIIINLKHSSFTSDEVPRYILALQNALVLSACLEAHNAT